jgi:diaminohydroxyphosphoribosylaminopyrimidine deaminase/5-amino-6-(5-phosphoribosylamino)uracil reductase
MSRQGVYILGLDKGKPFDLEVVLKTLAALGVSSVLVEGGAYTAGEFLRNDMVNKLHILVANQILGAGTNSISFKRSSSPASLTTLRDVTCRAVGPDFLIEGTL